VVVGMTLDRPNLWAAFYFISHCLTLGMGKKGKKKDKKTPMEELTKGYEKFIEGKVADHKGAENFDKALKKAVKSPSSK
jgi:hypothetical protein